MVVLTEKGMTAGRSGKPFSPLDLRRALKDRLAGYKIPQEMKVVDEIPRNAMGKSESFSVVAVVKIFKDRLLMCCVDSQQEEPGSAGLWGRAVRD